MYVNKLGHLMNFLENVLIVSKLTQTRNFFVENVENQIW